MYQNNNTEMVIIEDSFSDATIIKDYIDKDLQSPFKREMATGVKYYNIYNDIFNIDYRKYYVDGQELIDENKANHHIPNPFHRLLVNQKVAYIAGKPLTISTKDDNKEYEQGIINFLGEKLNDVIPDWIQGASNKGVEWLHPYVDEDGNFSYIIIPAEQIIPIYDTSYQKNLDYIIRYYEMEFISHDKQETKYRVELWDKQKVTYYIQGESGIYDLDDSVEVNPRFHLYAFNTNEPDNMQGVGWGKVPFVRLDNNSDFTTDLKPIKAYIDAYDRVSTGFLNDLDDIQMAIWILKGYGGSELSEFMKNLIKFKVIKVDEDGDVTNQTLEIPTAAREFMMNRLEELIYELGEGVRMNTDKFGQNPSGVALKFLYSGLDLKANRLIRKLKKALQEFIWFLTEYINMSQHTEYDYKTVKFTVNKSMITNELELVQMAQQSKDIISDETILDNHPWVEDSTEEIGKLKQQIKEKAKEASKAFGSYNFKKVDGDDEE